MELSDSAALKFAMENGIIDINTIHKQIEMNERKKYLEMHKYGIWQGGNGCWYTYLPTKEGGRIQKKRITRESLEDLIVDYYKEKSENPIIYDIFYEWINRKQKYNEIQKGTADRYETDFLRFFCETGFSNRKIKNVDTGELEDFVRTQIAENHLTMKSYSNLRIIIRGIWGYAKKKKWTDISISEFFGDLDISRHSFKKTIIERENEVFSEDEIPKIVRFLKNNPSIWNLGILLVLQTGLRVGELSSLKKEDWNGECILKVRRTEIRHKNEHGKNVLEVRDFSKTEAGMRDIILSNGGKETLKKIIEINPDGKYLFENSEGKRIRGNTFNKSLDIVLKKLGLHHRSIHKGRKTYGTTLIDSGCEDSLVMSQLGHTSIETSRKYYYYSNTTRNHQIQKIQEAVTI